MQLRPVISALFVLAMMRVADAQVLGPNFGLEQKVSVNVSGFWADVNTVARAGGSGGQVGTRLDLEQDLGLDDHDLRFIGSLTYQFNRRHGMELSYFDLNRSASRTLSAEIAFRDQTFSRQTTLETTFDTAIWRLSYSYAFVDNPRHRATAQIGLHLASISASLNRVEGTNDADANADAPLPVLGFGYGYRFSPRWMFELRGQIFRLEIDDIDGRIDNFSAVIGVAAFPTVSLYAGYNYYLMDVDISKRFWNGETKLDYQGPWVGFVVGFGGES